MVLSGRAVPRSEQNKKYLEISDRLAAFSNVKTRAESTEQIKFYQNNNEPNTGDYAVKLQEEGGISCVSARKY